MPRIIPCLLLRDKGLVKTVKFRDARYIGDPINAVRIFNEKQVDELIFLDITASRERRKPPLDVVAHISDECLMPLAFGGGISTIDDVREVLHSGAEKVSINTASIENPELINKAAEMFGNQSIVVSIDVRKKIFGKYEIYILGGSKPTGIDPIDFIKEMEERGAGEILINSIDRDGTMKGYDIELIAKVCEAVNVPVIACGGAGKLEDFSKAIKEGGASAVAAGSFFVFYGRRKAVLINYPEKKDLESITS